MFNLIKISGLVFLLVYSVFNIANILYFKIAVGFIGLLILGLAALYFVQRTARVFANGLRVSSAEIMAVGLLLLGSVALALQRILYDNFIGFDGTNVQELTATAWMLCVLWFLIGGAVGAASIKESPALAILLAGSVTVMMGFGIDEELFSSFDIDDAEVGVVSISHLTLERHIIIPLILAYAMSPKTRWLVAVCGIFCLFLLGGRTALFVFIITVVLMNVRGNLVRNIAVLLAMGAVLFLGLRYAIGNGIIHADNPQVRDILFLQGVSDDGSFNSRVTIWNESLQDLPQQFLVGNYSLTVERFGGTGAYIHNLLSAWQIYGFFMLLAIVAAIAYSLWQMYKSMARTQSPMAVFSSFILIYVVISVVVAKYVGWPLLWFALGLWMLRPLSSSASRSRSRSGVRKRRRKRVMRLA